MFGYGVFDFCFNDNNNFLLNNFLVFMAFLVTHWCSV